jgi:hypothetical protein
MNVYRKFQRAIGEGGIFLVAERLFNKMRWALRTPSYLPNVNHRIGKKLPEIDVPYVPLQRSKSDVQIAERILKSFTKARADEHKKITGDIWDRIQEKHADFYAICHNPVQVADYLNDMNQRAITLGISSSTRGEFCVMHKNEAVRQGWGVFTKDMLVCLAEAIGALPYNLTGDNLYVSEKVILDAIEKKMGISIQSSNIEGGLYKLKVGEHLFVHRDFWSLYIAWRAVQLVGSSGVVAEIGGGMGKVAFFARQFGLRNYSIYDLPIINVVQAWYLIKSGLEVTLYGEEGRSGIAVLPYWEFEKDSFDLTINVDSFPEMDESIIAEYLAAIKKNTKKYLLSINQEETRVYGEGRKHIVVQDIVAKVGGFKRAYRLPFWFLRNYVEELYEVD